MERMPWSAHVIQYHFYIFLSLIFCLSKFTMRAEQSIFGKSSHDKNFRTCCTRLTFIAIKMEMNISRHVWLDFLWAHNRLTFQLNCSKIWIIDCVLKRRRKVSYSVPSFRVYGYAWESRGKSPLSIRKDGLFEPKLHSSISRTNLWSCGFRSTELLNAQRTCVPAVVTAISAPSLGTSKPLTTNNYTILGAHAKRVKPVFQRVRKHYFYKSFRFSSSFWIDFTNTNWMLLWLAAVVFGRWHHKMAQRRIHHTIY